MQATNKIELIESIAKDKGLNPRQTGILFALFSDRFKSADSCYISEWAERLLNGCAWSCADGKTRKVLTENGLISETVRGYIKDKYFG